MQYDEHARERTRWINQKFADALGIPRPRKLIDYAGGRLISSQLWRSNSPRNWWERLLYFQVRRIVDKVSWGITMTGYRVGKMCDHVAKFGSTLDSGYARWLMKTLGPYDPWWRRALRELGEKMTTYPIIEDFEEIKHAD